MESSAAARTLQQLWVKKAFKPNDIRTMYPNKRDITQWRSVISSICTNFAQKTQRVTGSRNTNFLYLFCHDFRKINSRIKIFENVHLASYHMAAEVPAAVGHDVRGDANGRQY
jgi:hypothetical protein